ncbi:MAG: hypothetical protein PUC66_02730 [Erysipelotrichaceae bacterium]|nr:hypothetical protein [Erysipelotrichaceae bacterium]
MNWFHKIREEKHLEHLKNNEAKEEKTKVTERLYFLITVVNSGQASAIVKILTDQGVSAAYVCHGNGTASSDLYNVFGLSNQEKQVIFAPIRYSSYPEIKEALEQRYEASKYAKGVSMLLAVEALIGKAAYKFLANQRDGNEAPKEVPPMEEIKAKENYEAIFAIVNNGYADLVMEAAKGAGARGGTVLNAHGTGNKEMEKFFGIVITPEKQIVMILVPKTIKDSVLTAIYNMAGLATKGQGIAFAVSASDVIGLTTEEEKTTQESDSPTASAASATEE